MLQHKIGHYLLRQAQAIKQYYLTNRPSGTRPTHGQQCSRRKHCEDNILELIREHAAGVVDNKCGTATVVRTVLYASIVVQIYATTCFCIDQIIIIDYSDVD